MDVQISAKAAKRRRQRQRQREKLKEKKLNENHLDQSERQQEEVKEEEMNKAPEKTKEQILAERQAKKAAKQEKKVGSEKAVAVNGPAGKKEEPKAGAAKPQTVTKPQVTSPTSAKPPVASSTSGRLSNSSPSKVPAKTASPSSPQTKPAVKNEKPQAVQSSPGNPVGNPEESEKSRDQIQQEREARKLAKQSGKKKVDGSAPQPAPAANPLSKVESSKVTKSTNLTNVDAELAGKVEKLQITNEISNHEVPGKAKPASKAERRAIQEAQRAAKAQAHEEKKAAVKPATKKPGEAPAKKSQELKEIQHKTQLSPSNKTSALHKVKLFKHLYSDKSDLNLNVNNKIHPSIIKVGLQYASDSVVGSNARCYAFLNAMKILINDYETPPEKEFSRGLEAEIQPAIEFLQNCRPFAVSMTNALKHIKVLISLETSSASDDEKKQRLVEKIDTYASEQIETAAIAISMKVRTKISNGDVILTYGCSSLIKRTLLEAHKDSLRFRVIVVDSRPDHEGQEMLKSLTMLGINCTYVLINAISFIIPEVSKVLLGAHALLANGYVMSRVGTAQIALVANSYNVPVLVCCETHKFSERVQTDAFVFNELGDPNALVMNKNSREAFDHLKDWETIPHLTPLNIRYDITPPEFVTAVVTEVAILPCTSVQVILRVKPAE